MQFSPETLSTVSGHLIPHFNLILLSAVDRVSLHLIFLSPHCEKHQCNGSMLSCLDEIAPPEIHQASGMFISRVMRQWFRGYPVDGYNLHLMMDAFHGVLLSARI
jgi:hypothetical protein